MCGVDVLDHSVLETSKRSNPEVLYVTHDDGEEDARAPSPTPSPPSSPRNTHALERKSSKILSSPKKRDGSEGGAGW